MVSFMKEINVTDSPEINVCEAAPEMEISEADFNTALEIASYTVSKGAGIIYKRNGADPLNSRFAYMDFSVETYSALRRAGFHTVGDILKDLDSAESRLRNFLVEAINEDGFSEIITALKKQKFNVRNVCKKCRKHLSWDDLKTDICNNCDK